MIRVANKIMCFIISFYFHYIKQFSRNRFFLFLQKSFHYCYLRYFGVDTEFSDVKLVGLPIINKYKNSTVIIGKGVTLISTPRGNVAGINHPVILIYHTYGKKVPEY